MESFDDEADVREDLLFANQTIESLLSEELWTSLCPHLSTCTTCPTKKNTNDVEANLFDLKQSFLERGYLKLEVGQLGLPQGMCDLLADGMKCLAKHGYAPNFLLMYDEAWLVGKHCAAIVSPASGNAPIGDWYVFHVDPSCSYSPGPPHRDRPLAGPTSFRQPEGVKGQVEAEVAEVAEEVEDASDESAPEGEDQNGAPKYCSVWVALTDATPENSCLYFVPKSLDKGYYAEGDALGVVDLRHIVAQPLAAGGMLAFSHRVLHWASQPLAQLGPAALPGGGSTKDLAGGIPAPLAQDKVGFSPRSRMALSFAFADPDFEEPYFDHTLYLSMGTGTGTGTDDIEGAALPPMGLRLGLVAGQAIQYEHMIEMDKHAVAFYRRVFHSQKEFFLPAYYEKISSTVQFLAFRKQQERQRSVSKGRQLANIVSATARASARSKTL